MERRESSSALLRFLNKLGYALAWFVFFLWVIVIAMSGRV
jgi:hypothetical protein